MNILLYLIEGIQSPLHFVMKATRLPAVKVLGSIHPSFADRRNTRLNLVTTRNHESATAKHHTVDCRKFYRHCLVTRPYDRVPRDLVQPQESLSEYILHVQDASLSHALVWIPHLQGGGKRVKHQASNLTKSTELKRTGPVCGQLLQEARNGYLKMRGAWVLFRPENGVLQHVVDVTPNLESYCLVRQEHASSS